MRLRVRYRFSAESSRISFALKRDSESRRRAFEVRTYLSNFLTGQRIFTEAVPWKTLAIPPILRSTFALKSV